MLFRSPRLIEMIIRRYIKKVGPISIKGQDLRVLDLSRLGEVEDVVNGMSPELQGCDMTATLPAQDLVSSRALGLRQVQTSGTKLPGCGVWEPVNEEPGCSLHQAHGLGERESEQMENVTQQEGPGEGDTPGSQAGARGEGERVMALESREGTRASRRVEEGLSRSLSGGAGNPRFPRLLPGTLGIAWRIPGTGEPGGLPSLGSHRVGHD